MNILTFDIEEWFHLLDHEETRSEKQWSNFPSRIERNLDKILGLLADKQCSATFFCLGWVAEKYPHLVRRITESGYQVASHSQMHQLAYEQTPDEFRADLRRSVAAISDATGLSVDIYRAPGFSLTEDNLWLFQVLGEEGIEIDCSVFPANRGHGGLPIFETDKPCWVDVNGMRIREFPINVQTFGPIRFIFSGGGYFRLLPYNILRQLFSNNDYVMTYFHPRDFDPDQPVIPNLPFHRRFKSYVGLGSAMSKLDKLLDEFEFVDIRTAIKTVDWASAKVVSLQ